MEREINFVCIGCSWLYHNPCSLSRYELSIFILLVKKSVFKTNDDPFDMLESISYSNTFTHLFLPCYNVVNNTSTVYCVCSYVMDRLCGLVVRVSGYRYRGPGFDSRRYQIF